MKKLYLYLIMTIAIAFFSSCTGDEEKCLKFDKASFEEEWTVELEQYYNYNNVKWCDMGKDFVIISNSYEYNILQLFDKETGKLKNSMSIKLTGGYSLRNKDKIFTYKNLIIFEHFEKIYFCNPYNNEISKIRIDNTSDIFVTGNKILYSSYQYSPKLDRIIMYDIDNHKQEVLVQKYRSDNDIDKFKSPYLYISKSNDSILYYLESDYGSTNRDRVIIYNLKTKQVRQGPGNDINPEFFIQDNNDLFVLDKYFIRKLNPNTLSKEWEIKMDDSWSILLSPDYNVIEDDLIVFSHYRALSVNKNTGQINWNKKLSFINDVGKYYKTKKIILAGDFLYIIYDKNNLLKTINVKTGDLSGFYCQIPKAINGQSFYGKRDTLYSISYLKEMRKYLIK